jgi:hypothetical protein
LKKIFAILLAALFVLSFAASAFAIHAEIPSETQAVVGTGTTQITLGGELRVRGWYTDNVSSNFTPVKSNSAAWYDERVRLSLDAKVSPNVEGMVQLETNGANGSPHDDSYVWGNFDSKPDTLSILQAWIMYSGSGLLGVPAGMKIGHMPLALGQGVFFDHTKYGDDAIVLFANPMKELEVDALAIKFNEGFINQNTDDTDGYVGIATYKIDDKNTIGLNYTYLNQSSTSSLSTPFNELGLSNLELAGNGTLAVGSGLGYKYSADFQFGTVFKDANKSHDAKGWAAMVGLNYMIDPINIRGMFAYGSGQKNEGDGDIDEFITFLGDDQHFTFVYDYNVMTASLVNSQNTHPATDTGIANTTYYNLGIDVTPVKDLKLSVDGYILEASKTDGWEKLLNRSVSSSIGWELDAKIAYNIAKNLTYEVDGGYLNTGDFYDDVLKTANESGNIKNPVVLMHKLTLSF